MMVMDRYIMQKARNKELEARVETLLNERDVLKGRVQQLKVLHRTYYTHISAFPRTASSAVCSPSDRPYKIAGQSALTVSVILDAGQMQMLTGSDSGAGKGAGSK